MSLRATPSPPTMFFLLLRGYRGGVWPWWGHLGHIKLSSPQNCDSQEEEEKEKEQQLGPSRKRRSCVLCPQRRRVWHHCTKCGAHAYKMHRTVICGLCLKLWTQAHGFSNLMPNFPHLQFASLCLVLSCLQYFLPCLFYCTYRFYN